MGSFVEALFSACIAGALVWFVVRRGNTGGGSASTTAEIDRLRAVVEELSASLERRAEAAEHRLGKVINEAQGVQSVLDRALTAVGAQLVRQEATPEPAPRETEARELAVAPIAASVITAVTAPQPASQPIPAVEPTPIRSMSTEVPVEPVREPAAPVVSALAAPSDLLHVPAANRRGEGCGLCQWVRGTADRRRSTSVAGRLSRLRQPGPQRLLSRPLRQRW